MAKRKELKGTTIIELNHSGIPDDELKPEEFNDYQLDVLKALPPERQTPIRRGCPVSVIDLATGNQMAAFNMHNVAPSELQKKQLGKAMYEAILYTPGDTFFTMPICSGSSISV